MQRFKAVLVLAAVAASSPALAHTGVGLTSGFDAGFLHPLGGHDHLLVMVAIGLWAGLAGGQARWAWPLCFVAAMVVGGWAGMSGMALPAVELSIAASVAVLGLLVALRAGPPVAVGGVLSALLALAHGHAHGSEIPLEADAVSYAAGFVLATALLHAAGIGLGLVTSRLHRLPIPALAGGAMTVTGILLMIG